jgi:hypothetical protein
MINRSAHSLEQADWLEVLCTCTPGPIAVASLSANVAQFQLAIMSPMAVLSMVNTSGRLRISRVRSKIVYTRDSKSCSGLGVGTTVC